MNAGSHDAETILAQALEGSDPVEGSACLDRACAGDEALRQKVESLLAAQQQAGGFMNTAAMAVLAARTV